MTDKSRVVWSEGLFLRPQHFQQQQRHVEHFIEQRAGHPHRHLWGVLELEIDQELLRMGKLAMRRARGVFPDGTPFSMPDEDPLPAPLEISTQVRNQVVYLALPVRQSGATEIERESRQSLVRCRLAEFEARDVTRESSELVPVEVSAINARLLLESAALDDFVVIHVARVTECRADRQVLLDESFMPTSLDIAACSPLRRFMLELVGMVAQRADEVSRLVGRPNHASVSDLSEFLRLQAFNRHEPLLRHLSRSQPVHPEEFYWVLLGLFGELATLAGGSRRPSVLPEYVHRDLQASFEPLINELRQLLDARAAIHVIAIPIELMRPNYYRAIVKDSNLFESCNFVIAAKAQTPQEIVRRQFPSLTTIVAAPQLDHYLKHAGMAGIGIHPLGSLPPSIPFHAGFEYFQLDRSHPAWRELKTAGVFGLFVGNALPGLEMQMWALPQ